MTYKRHVLLFAALVLVSMLSACIPWRPQPSLTKQYTDRLEALVVDEPDANPDDVGGLQPGGNTYEQTLQYVCGKMRELEPTISFECEGEDDKAIEELMRRVAAELDLPDIGYKGTYWEKEGGLEISLTPEYRDSFAVRMYLLNPDLAPKLSKSANELYGKATAIAKELQLDQKSDVEIALALHNDLLERVEYAPEEEEDDEDSATHDAKGALIDGVAVCDGYTDAYQLLLAIAGIRSIPVVGTADGGSHAWNLVQLQNQWYHVDVTWDDPKQDQQEAVKKEDEYDSDLFNSYHYGYFLIDDDWMSQDHSWKEDLYPAATSLKLNPFYAAGLVVDSYDAFKELILQSLKKGEREISMYVKHYNRQEYPMDFLKIVPVGYSYMTPKEGKSGEFRLLFHK